MIKINSHILAHFFVHFRYIIFNPKLNLNNSFFLIICLKRYYGMVAPYFNSNFLVETWRNGDQSLNMPSNCTRDQPQVFNVDCVQVAPLGGYTFSYKKDHSKWAVMRGSKGDVACVGDINRQYSQQRRGGGTMCFKSNKSVWNAYRKLVSDSCQAPCGA